MDDAGAPTYANMKNASNLAARRAAIARNEIKHFWNNVFNNTQNESVRSAYAAFKATHPDRDSVNAISNRSLTTEPSIHLRNIVRERVRSGSINIPDEQIVLAQRWQNLQTKRVTLRNRLSAKKSPRKLRRTRKNNRK